MIRVEDPAGAQWIRSREWFGLPGWLKRKPSLEDGIDSLQAMPDLGGLVDDLSSAILAVVLLIAALVVLTVFWIFFLPLVFLGAGILAAILALGARILSLSAWTIHATGPGGTLNWRVRGVLHSRRVMHEVASRLQRGEEPLVRGIAGTFE